MKLAKNSWVSSWQSPSGLPKVYPTRFLGSPTARSWISECTPSFPWVGPDFFLHTRNLTVIRLWRLWPFGKIFLWGWEVWKTIGFGWKIRRICAQVAMMIIHIFFIPGRGWSWMITISIVNDLHIYIHTYTIITYYYYYYYHHYYYIHGFRFPISQLMEVKIP